MNSDESPASIRCWLAEPLSADVARSIERIAASEDVRHVAVMPDVHLSGDVCVGLAVATRDLIYPAAVGGDIGCGMAAVRFQADADLLADEHRAARLLAELYRRIPANKHSRATMPTRLPETLQAAALSDPRLEKLKGRDGRVQFGTLGRGNHFLEFQADREGQGWLMVHSGSRAIGQADVITQCVYDWRNRLIAAKEGVQVSEDTSTNRPLTYQMLDNLGEVVQLDVYDSDGVSMASLGTTNGVPNAPSSSLLRARTMTAYDEQGRAYQITQAVVDQVSGDVLSTRTTNAWYDHRGNRIKSQSPAGSVTKNQYDGAGRPVLEATTDGGGDTTWADGLNLTGDTVLERTQYQYDAVGNVTTVTDGLGHSTSYVYDDANRLTSQTDATDATTTYAYDAAGRLYSLTDPDGNATTWGYDLLGRPFQEATSLGARSYTYNSAGDVTRKTDRNGRVTTYTYNSLGQQTAETWLDAQGTTVHAISYTYDTTGDLLTASDGATSYTYGYDVLDRVVAVSQTIAGLAPSVVFAQQFDALGNRIQLVSTIAGTADFVNDYAYNGLDEVTSITQHSVTGGNAVAAKRFDVAYAVDGRLSTITRYADLAGTQQVATSTYAFDDAYRLVGLSYTKGTTTLASYAYTYDDASNITSMTTIDGTATYTSDDADQLVSVDSTYTDDESYTYDDNGNRVTANSGSYTTGTNNRLFSDGTHAYTYDAEGNRTAKFLDADADGVLDAGDTDITTYTWDYRNRLTEVDLFAAYANYTVGTSEQIVTYTYDAFNRMVRRTLDADGSSGTGDIDQTVYVYDGDQIGLQFDKTSANGSASDLWASDLSHRYLWNPQAIDQLFADEELADGEVLFALTDHQGTVRDLATYDVGTDNTTIANHRVYDSYGNLKSETNAAVDCLFGYTGRQYDSATGLQNNLNRWYDPSTGRWLSEDPIEFAAGDTNVYSYCGNSPVCRNDPSGLLTVHVWSAADGWGHASMHLDNGTYISWWPQSDNRDYGKCNWGWPVSSYSVDAIEDRGFLDDIKGEDYRLPTDTKIEGLAEEAIQQWWDKFKSDPENKWSSATQNCSTTVAEGLKAGGADVDWADTSAAHNVIWRPNRVQEFADAVNKHLGTNQQDGGNSQQSGTGGRANACADGNGKKKKG